MIQQSIRLAVYLLLAIACTACGDANQSYPPHLEETQNDATPTHDQKLWALATAAVLTESNSRRHDLLGGSERTPDQVQAECKLLAEWWGVQNREDFLETLEWIRQGGHRRKFDEIANELSLATSGQIDEISSRVAENALASNRVEVVLKYKDEFGPKSITAWDYDRYVSLCGWGYIAGYLTEEEAWQRIMPAARLLQNTFDSWEDLGKNHVVGRTFWSFKHTQRRGELTRRCYLKLLSHPASPWKHLPWDMDLNPPQPQEEQNKRIDTTS